MACALAILCWLNLLAPADRLLADARFDFGHRQASQELAFVEIDSASIERMGVWPWPRSTYAAIIDRLIELNAREVWIDVDFSAKSSEAEDAALEAALEAAGGYVHLAAFRRSDGDRATLALPLDRFTEHAGPFSVNVVTDGLGVVRFVPSHISDGRQTVGSLVSALAGDGRAVHTIDYGIMADTVPVISAASLLEGTVDASKVAARHVVVGASALELADYFYTPGQGPLPGAMIQILAAETAMADRGLVVLPNWWAIAALAIVLVLMTILPIRNAPLCAACLVLCSLIVEAVALGLYQSSALVLPTAAFHVGLALHLLGTLIIDARLFERLAHRMGGERDAFRAMLEQAIADNYDGVLVVRADGRIVSASRFAETFLDRHLVGYSMQEVLPPEIAADMKALKAGQASKKGQITVENALGPRQIEYVATFSASGEKGNQITTLTFRDITDRIRNERKLVYLAEHDPITDTLSRSGFTRRVNEEFGEPGAQFGIFVVQMERFRAITASLGHEAGDQMLRQFAERLLECGIGPVAHLGQAQFAVAAQRPAQELFDEIKKITGSAFNAAGHSVTVSVSAGYATAGPGDTPQQCLRRAEAALVSDGRALGKLVHYDHAQSARLSRNRWIETQLAKAHQENQFFLLFQPQVDLRSHGVIGAEALIRWRRDRETIAPGDFLHVAEETGRIVEMTRWILLEACRAAMTWPDPMRVAVNISALHFELGDLLADVTEALEKSGLPARRLEIEITETATVDTRLHTIAVLRQLRDMGVTVAIDDFGTGQSSLAYLDQLPFDIIKIDKSFIDRLSSPSAPVGIVSAILGIARTMGKQVIAEGIEHEQQAELLARLGCDFGQGYYWSKPGDSAHLAKQVA